MGESWNSRFDCSSSIEADAVTTGVALIAHSPNIVVAPCQFITSVAAVAVEVVVDVVAGLV